MKVIYLALAGGSPDHDSHQTSQIQTWAAEPERDFQVIWIHGDPSLSEPQLKGRNLFLPIEETFENLLGKTLLAVRWVQENLEFDFLIRTNTSNYFEHSLVVECLGTYSSHDKVAGGVVAEWIGMINGRKERYSYISGAGIYMSASTTEILAKMNASVFTGVPDDVAIGSYLASNNVQFFKIPRNDVTDFKIIQPTPQTRVKSWKETEVTVKRMHEIHKIYNARERSLLERELQMFLKSEVKRHEAEKKRFSFLLQVYFDLSLKWLVKKFEHSAKKK